MTYKAEGPPGPLNTCTLSAAPVMPVPVMAAPKVGLLREPEYRATCGFARLNAGSPGICSDNTGRYDNQQRDVAKGETKKKHS